MDFASLMKSQISATPELGDENGGKSKYLKRSEVEAQRQAKYLREQQELEQARHERLEKKRKRDEEEAERNRMRDEKKRKLAEESKRIQDDEIAAEENARRTRLGLPALNRQETAEDTTQLAPDVAGIPEEDLLAKLREMGEPRILFAETHIQRLRRYHKLIQKLTAPVLSDGPIPTTIDLVPEAEMKVPESVPKDVEAQQYVLRQLASYFDMVLREWNRALSRRSRDVKESASGKQAYNSFVAAKENLRPFFKKIEKHDVAPHMLAAVLEIVHLAQLKRYVHANDAYLRLSIGKAAWPIGVTMVGIHERSAREKLHETEKTGNQAHIMSDEVTRKMLQGIKRCLSYAQTRWPPDDISQLMG